MTFFAQRESEFTDCCQRVGMVGTVNASLGVKHGSFQRFGFREATLLLQGPGEVVHGVQCLTVVGARGGGADPL